AVAPLRRQLRVGLGGGSRVWAPDLPELLVAYTYARTDGLVVDDAGAHSRSDLIQLRIERAQALHVAGIANVHGRRQGGDAGAWMPVAGGEKIRHRAIGVVRQHDVGYRQPEPPRPDARHGVAEIAAGDDERRPLAMTPEDREARGGVVDGLRQQSTQVDAVGGRKRTLFPPAAIEERLLDELLTVIERAAHREGPYVAAPAGELPLLGG